MVTVPFDEPVLIVVLAAVLSLMLVVPVTVRLVVALTTPPCNVAVVVILLPVEIVPKPDAILPAAITPVLLTVKAPLLIFRLLPARAPVAVTVAPCNAAVVVMLLPVEIVPKPVVILPADITPALDTA